MQIKDYFRAETLEEAIKQYEKGGSILLAGGTDLMVKAKGKSIYGDKILVDISGLSELKNIGKDDKKNLHIGAAVTLSELLDSAVIQREFPLLYQAADNVGNCQIRNRATLAGNAANACPAADCIPALMVMDAEIHTISSEGRRVIPIADLYRECRACLRHEGMHVRTCFYGNPAEKKLTLKPGEIIEEIVIPERKNEEKHYFFKLSENRSAGLGIMNIAMVGALDREGKIMNIRVCLGGIFPKPVCMDAYNLILIGQRPSEEKYSEYALQISREIEKEKSILADYEYKKTAAPSIVKEGLAEIFGGR